MDKYGLGCPGSLDPTFLAHWPFLGPFGLFCPQGSLYPDTTWKKMMGKEKESEMPFIDELLCASHRTKKCVNCSHSSPYFCQILSSSFHAQGKWRLPKINGSKWQAWDQNPSLGPGLEHPKSFSFRKFKQLLGTHANSFYGPWISQRMVRLHAYSVPVLEHHGDQHLSLSLPVINWATGASQPPQGSDAYIPSFDEINTLDAKEVVLQMQF